MEKYLYYKATVTFKNGSLRYNLLVLVGLKNNLLSYQLRHGFSNEKVKHNILTDSVLPIVFQDIQFILEKNGLECTHENRKDYFDNIFSDKFNILESKIYY